MQNAAFAAIGFDGAYVALPVAPDELEAAVRGARALGFGGLNVTVPHKEAVVPLCAALDDVAAQVGAVNVLAPPRPRLGRLQHRRTGGAGAAHRRRDRTAAPGRWCSGAGGAARAAIWALVGHGGERPGLGARAPEAADELARDMTRALELPGRDRRAPSTGRRSRPRPSRPTSS